MYTPRLLFDWLYENSTSRNTRMYIVVFSCGGLTDMYIYVCTSKVEVLHCQADVLIPYRMKIYTELNLAT